MTRMRIPEGEDWKDYATPCTNCGEPVLSEHEHYVSSTEIDPGWWRCNTNEETSDANAED